MHHHYECRGLPLLYCNNCFKFSYRAPAPFSFFFFFFFHSELENAFEFRACIEQIAKCRVSFNGDCFQPRFVKFPSCTFQYVTMRLPIIVSTFSHRHYFTKPIHIYIYTHVKIDADFCSSNIYIYIYTSSLSTVNFLSTYLCIATINNVETNETLFKFINRIKFQG